MASKGAGRPHSRCARSVVEISATDGAHAWLNCGVLVGTLEPLMAAGQAVRIREFQVN